MTILKGTVFIVMAAILAVLLAISIEYTHQELGFLINFFWPAILGLLFIILFLVVCTLTENKMARMIVVTVCCIYLMYAGITFHFPKPSWPLVLW